MKKKYVTDKLRHMAPLSAESDRCSQHEVTELRNYGNHLAKPGPAEGDCVHLSISSAKAEVGSVGSEWTCG